jgi:hypothetical protein
MEINNPYIIEISEVVDKYINQILCYLMLQGL